MVQGAVVMSCYARASPGGTVSPTPPPRPSPTRPSCAYIEMHRHIWTYDNMCMYIYIYIHTYIYIYIYAYIYIYIYIIERERCINRNIQKYLFYCRGRPGHPRRAARRRGAGWRPPGTLRRQPRGYII